jgi:hypothetical protein
MSFSSDQSLLANQLPISVELPKDSIAFQDTISLLYKRIASSVNTKEGALYALKEQATFQQYYKSSDPQNFRAVYRTVVDFGTLPNAGVKTVAHNIPFDSNYTLTRLYGASTDPTALTYIALPHVSITPANGVSLVIDATNVIITTGINRTSFTRTSVVIEYTKNL